MGGVLETALAPALAPWGPFVFFPVNWGRVAMLGKLGFEEAPWGWRFLLCFPPKPGLFPFTLLTQGRLGPTGSWVWALRKEEGKSRLQECSWEAGEVQGGMSLAVPSTSIPEVRATAS